LFVVFYGVVKLIDENRKISQTNILQLIKTLSSSLSNENYYVIVVISNLLT